MGETRGEPVAEVRYKAGDVCRMADVQPYVLRYWESEFSVLAPDRGAPGPRLYTPRDVKIIERIKKLLYDEGYTIAGAKKRLEGELKSDGVTMVAPEPPAPAAARPRRVTVAPEPVELPAPEPAVADVEIAGGPEIVRDVSIASAPEPEPKRRRSKAAASEEAPPAALFAEPKPEPELESPTVRMSPRALEPSMAGVVDELKQILALLSRDEP